MEGFTAASLVGQVVGSVLGLFGAIQRGIQHSLECLNELSVPRLEIPPARTRLETLSSELETQEVIFVNEIQWLLSIIDIKDGCNDMVKNPDHLLWKDRSLDEEIRNRFGESFDTWMSRLRSIDEIMRTVLDEILKRKDRLDAKVSFQICYTVASQAG